MLDVGMQHVKRLKNIAKKAYIVTIDSKDYSGTISATHIPLSVGGKKYLKHLSFLIKSFKKISRILRENRQKRILLVARTFMAGMIISLLSKMYRVPSLIYYQYDWTAWKKIEGNLADYIVARLAEKISLRYSTAILTTTPTLRKKIIDRGYDADRVYVVPNPVNIEKFRPMNKTAVRRKLGMKEEEKSILFAGRLVSQKNLFVLLKAVRRVNGVRLYMAGGGDQEEKLRDLTLRLGIENRVVFLGRISQEVLVEYMNACDVFVLPSLYEGHPKVLVEAMACGCAVIASDVEGNNDVVVDGKNGLLFQSRSDSELAEKIKILIENPEVATKLKNNALRASKKYDIVNILSKEREISLSLMNQLPSLFNV
jgi:glycosyltransferase involved in cell wall biosynthesis